MTRYNYFDIGDYTVTLATKQHPKVQDAWLVGVAFCSPSDNFCKKTGRQLADERIDSESFLTYEKRPALQLLNYVFAKISSRLIPEGIKNAIEGEMEYVVIPRYLRLF